MQQLCQSCHKQVRLEDCIEHQACGWVHVFCEADEARGLPSIQSGFRRARLDAIESEERSVKRRLTYDLESDISKCSPERGEEEEDISECNTEELLYDCVDSSEEDNETPVTYEQKKILDHNPTFGGPPVCVNALAGCGKTTTIALLCLDLEAKYPTFSKLYLVFNKKNQTEAMQSGNFPKKNMEIRTTHAFVLRYYFGVENMHNFKPLDDYTLDDIKEVLGLDSQMKQLFPKDNPRSRKFKAKVNLIASYVRKTVHNFQASDKIQISKDHIFWRATRNTNLSGRSKWRERIPASHYRDWAAEFFRTVTQRCHDVQGGGINISGISHDGYLKVCQLEMDATADFQIVIVDEAQDLTACQAAMFWGNPDKRSNRVVYLFGDRYQQLYRFRGASTSFQDSWKESPYQFNLTGSFRFGPNIANVASHVLKAMGGEELVGRALDPGEVHDESGFDNDGVVLCRTNQGVYEYLFSNNPCKWCYLDGSSRAFPDPPRWVYRLESFLATVRETDAANPPSVPDSDDEDLDLEIAEEGTSTFTYKDEVFCTLDEIKSFIDDEGDRDLLKFLQLLLFLKFRGEGLDGFINSIRQSFCRLEGKPDDFAGVVIGTVHKAKGLEFSRVLIYEDFKFSVIERVAVSENCYLDEANIIYVALTRAKDHMFLSRPARACLDALSRRRQSGNVPLLPHQTMAEVRALTNTRWESFQSERPQISSLMDIPWPSTDNSNILAIDSKMTEADQRSYLRTIMLRYHPDKFLTKFGGLIATSKNEELRNDIVGKLRDVIQEALDAYRALQSDGERLGSFPDH
jgi:UvrD-like helicase C-terminal domain/UvrD/REP helicase N-terminal domain